MQDIQLFWRVHYYYYWTNEEKSEMYNILLHAISASMNLLTFVGEATLVVQSDHQQTRLRTLHGVALKGAIKTYHQFDTEVHNLLWLLCFKEIILQSNLYNQKNWIKRKLNKKSVNCSGVWDPSIQAQTLHVKSKRSTSHPLLALILFCSTFWYWFYYHFVLFKNRYNLSLSSRNLLWILLKCDHSLYVFHFSSYLSSGQFSLIVLTRKLFSSLYSPLITWSRNKLFLIFEASNNCMMRSLLCFYRLINLSNNDKYECTT